MIWIIGEYAERIDNADELLEQFLESFPEETALVQLQLVTATVKLFLKKPTDRPQQMISQVLTYATTVRWALPYTLASAVNTSLCSKLKFLHINPRIPKKDTGSSL